MKDHLLPAFLTAEKAMIFGHIGRDIPHRDAVAKLFKSQTSGDELLKQAVFPILIAYDSAAAASHQRVCDEYKCSLESELSGLRDYFHGRVEGLTVRFRLIFVPLNDKAAVVRSFDAKLGAFC